jgi:hypothetical protein
MAEESFVMQKNEAVRLRVLDDFRSGRIDRAKAALLLGVSERAVTRQAAKIKSKGPSGIKHGNYRRTPVNKTDAATLEAALALAAGRYANFNLAHCHEKLRAEHGFTLCYETFRKACAEAGLGKRRKRRASKARLQRERMANEGLLLQLDGSPHRWNGRDEWCLVAAIDDATSKIPAARFFPTETTWACMSVLRTIIERYGVPEALYVDGAGWAGGGPKRLYFSQFVRACEELGIRVIAASSAEAKGRIERSFRTMQDRLVAELNLQGITGMTDANRYVDQVFLPQYWNARLNVVPRDEASRYRPLAPHQVLDEILCFKHWRRVRSDHTVSLDGKTYRLRPGELGSLKGKEVAAHVTEVGDVTWHYGSRHVVSELRTPPKRRWQREAS